MADINKMSLKEFSNLLKYIDYINKRQTGGVIPLKKSQKEMIRKAKEERENARL